MKKRVLVSLFSISLALHMTGCTSSDAGKDQDETAVAQDDSFQEEGSGDFDDGSKAADNSAAANTDVAKTDDTGAATGSDMAATDAPADAAAPTDAAAAPGNDELALDSGDASKEFPDDVAKTTEGAPAQTAAAPTDQGLFDNPPAQTDAAAVAPAEPPAAAGEAAPPDVAAGNPPADTGVVASQPAPETAATASDLATNAGTEAAAPVAAADAPKKSFAPLQRVKDAPFEEKGVNMNRYYVARQGDTTKNVSQKIYGSDRSKDLKAWNPILKARSMKVGDKVYYNSPKDPQDTAKMVSFYEENGVAPQSYVTKDGDDIRDVSKKLLGDKNSWKEVWATNSNIESKGKVPAGVEVRYWASTEGASPSAPAPNAKGNVASNEAASNGAGADQGLSDVPPPPPADMQANNGNVPPPPDMNNNPNGAAGAAAGAMGAANGNMPPPPPGGPDAGAGAPPPPAQAAAPPPPPPPPAAPPAQMNKKPAQVADTTTSDNDQTMMLGAGGLLVLGGVLAFSVLRRKKASKARIDMTQTQV